MEYLKKNKKFLILYSILVILGISAIIFTFNNYKYYDTTIAKIDSVEDKYDSTETITYGYKEDSYKETIEATILNGEYKGEKVTIQNEYHKGQTYDQKYHKNDEIFVYLNIKKGKIKNTYIEGYKRDKYIVMLIVFMLLVIVLVGRLKGFLSVVSVIVNIVVFNILVYLNVKGISLILLSYIGAIIFSTICLTLVSGLNKKTVSSIISSITSITIVTLMALLIVKLTKYEGIRFEQMDLLTRPCEGMFMAEIILGGLGAIMDVSITMASSFNELIEKDNKITTKQLRKSGREIGQDVMSTMINVLFFTYICSVIPNLTIYFRNGIEISSLLSEYISLEMTRALTGAIGIVLTIPIAIEITLLVFKRRGK